METDNFGTWLQARRERLKLTRRMLAGRAKCSDIALQKYEYGERAPTRDVFESLMHAVEVPRPEWEDVWALAQRNAGRRDRPPEALHQLHPLLSTLHGREQLIEQAQKQVGQSHASTPSLVVVLTVTGIAGVGKTTFANALGHALAPDFPDAQLVVEMRAYSGQPRTVDQALRDALTQLGVGGKLPMDTAGLRRLYLSRLNDKRALIILDDALDDAQVEALLPAAGCVAIITSRQQLQLGANIRLECLARPDSVTCLRDYRPLTNWEADDLATLAGDLPLALTVLGGYLKRHHSLGVADYIRKVRQAGVTASPVTRALGAIIGRSVEVLSDAQRAAWAALSMMTASFDRAGAQAVIGDEPESLFAVDELVAHNLLEFDPDTERFGWHDLLREFAADRLRRSDDTCALAQARHAAFYLTSLSEKHLLGENQVETLRAINAEFGHIRAAWVWAIDNAHVDLMLLSVKPLTEFLRARSLFQDQRDLFSAALERLSTEAVSDAVDERQRQRKARLRGLLAARVADSLIDFGHYDEAYAMLAHVRDSLAHMGEYDDLAWVLNALGLAAHNLGRFDEAEQLYRQCANLAGHVSLTNHYVIGSQTNFGLILLSRGDYREADDLFQAITQAGIERKDDRLQAYAHGCLGETALAFGNFDAALAQTETARQLFERLNEMYGKALTTYRLSTIRLQLGQLDEAQQLGDESVALWDSVGRQVGRAYGLLALADVHVAKHAFADAEVLVREALQTFDDSNVQTQVAVCKITLGQIYLASKRPEDAAPLFNQSLTIFEERNCKPGMARALSGLGRCQAQSQPEQNTLFKRALGLTIETESAPLVGDVLLDVCKGTAQTALMPLVRTTLLTLQDCPNVGWPAKQIAARLFKTAQDLSGDQPHNTPGDVLNAARLMIDCLT